MVFTDLSYGRMGCVRAGEHGNNKAVFLYAGPIFSYNLRYIVGFWLVEMAISTNQKLTIYRNLYENTALGMQCTPISTISFKFPR